MGDAYILRPHMAAPPTGLDFPTNTQQVGKGTMAAFQFLNPQNDGLPFYGPSSYGITFIRKYRPKAQSGANGYVAALWYSQANGQFNEPYYGCHPYNNSGTYEWEIGCESNDYRNTLAGPVQTVTNGQWRTQALIVTANGDNTKTFRFYLNLPSVANGDIIERVTQAGYGTPSSSPAITVGDSPWFGLFGHETACGVLRAFKIFKIGLSETDMLAEAANESALATSNGTANIWWMKTNPTLTDLLCDAGTGRSPTWHDASNKPTLWTGP